MKKLLLINVSCNKGSTGRISEQIGNVAKNNGWDVYFAHGPRYVEKSKLNTLKVGNKIQNYFHAFFFYKLLGKNGLGSKKATKKLIKRIDEISPNIVHLHNIHGYYINFKILFEYLNTKKIPIVWTLHDCWCFTGGCTFLNHLKCEEWKLICGQCPLKGTFPRRPLFNRREYLLNLKKDLLKSNGQITLVPVSYWLEGLTRQSFLNSKNIVTIHNGVDVDIFKPDENAVSVHEKYAIKNKKIILGVASPWSARKGLVDFVRLSNKLESDYQIMLVGLSKQQINDLPSNIIGIERTSSPLELAKLYSAAYVYVNPTYSDNFPTTNIEALACGTPVVTYNTGGSPEAVDNQSGFVVCRGDVDGLSKAIHHIDDLGIEVNNYCRQRALANYNKENCYLKYIDLYNRILEG